MLIGIIAIGAVVAVLAVILALKALRFLLKLIRSSIMTQVIVTTILVAVIAMNWNLVDSHPIMAIVGTAIIVMLLISIAFEAYVSTYFKSKNFHDVKLSIAHHTENCNQLNDHIENLKSTFVEIASFDYGESSLRDTSGFKMKRRNWREHTKSNRIHNCSASVCKNAHDQPFKYICKYFDIKVNENTLSSFEELLNNFSAAEQGKVLLKNERDLIVSRIHNSIPTLIIRFKRDRVIRELGFDHIDLSDLYFPVYTFRYVSAGGNSSFRSDTKLNIQTLDKFIIYLGNLVSFRKSIEGQRALMTSALRESIKIRDNFTCRICNLSTEIEKHLLLEIDHIFPLSKGGITSEENLQTLCWKCNRSKGAKLISAGQVTN